MTNTLYNYLIGIKMLIIFINEYGTNRTKDDFKTIPAITDGQRVSVERINKILSIIERIKV